MGGCSASGSGGLISECGMALRSCGGDNIRMIALQVKNMPGAQFASIQGDSSGAHAFLQMPPPRGQVFTRLESTGPDVVVDVRRWGVEYSMDSDCPGLMICKKRMEFLVGRSEQKVHRNLVALQNT